MSSIARTSRRLVVAAAFLRAVATSTVAILLGLHLARAGLSASAIGGVVSAGLGGAAVGALVATVRGDRLGRRRSLIVVALLGAAGTASVALTSDPLLLVVCSFGGMVNGMGRDRGAALILEQSILPSTVADTARTRAFAWYNVLQDAGSGVGALLAGTPTLLRHLGADESVSYRAAFVGASILLASTAVLYAALPPSVETAPEARTVPVSAETRPILVKLSALFALDSLGGGFLSAALITLFFHERFGVAEETLGPLFFAGRAANAISHLGAAWLARRIGLVNTMVFTHVPSSFLLASVAFAPSFPIAAALFLLREALVEMDVPTRQSYVMAVVRPEERTFASGVTHLVRMAGWAVAPSFAGVVMQGVTLSAPLIVAAGLKLSYDAMLYVAVRRHHPPEEATGA